VRINPELGTSRTDNSQLAYAGEEQTKFGIYSNHLKEFITIAKKGGVEINTVHFHTGCGYLNDSLANLQQVFERANTFIESIGTIQRVNIGGGLGVPHQKSDASLDLYKWSKIIKQSFSKDIVIQVEPGEYIMKDAGILVVEKTFTEKKKKKHYVGINAGFNIAIEPAFYGLPFEPVILERYHGKFTTYDVVGNINEALDVWYKDLVVEDLQMHKYLAIINAGAYSSSMASNHCMRGSFREVLLVS
jgi:diaminopimelate decarboxylase